MSRCPFGLQADCIWKYLFVEDTDEELEDGISHPSNERMEFPVPSSFLVFLHHSFVNDK